MTVPEVKGYFKNRDDMLPFIGELLNEKILNFLSEESKFVEVAAEQEEKSSGSKAEKAADNIENQEKSGE
jgi:trigger factor